MSYKYLNEHPRAYYRWNVEENGSFRSNGVERNNCVQLYPEVEFHTQSRRVIVAVSQRTLPIMLLINEKKKMQKKKKTKHGIATANRISS